uniref:GIY-YIG endonuclease n=1 Tax=Ramaria rubella TaxID=113071 RepID=UPI002238C2D5|nr:GIY-YIG endonuclease [Ramaria rubella]UYR22227.1 GIY-YIG endonuclease [Ramaria rubella]
MATYINKNLIYSSELGEFYLAKNPSYSINAKSPVILIDIETDLATFCSSKRECARLLSDRLHMNIQLGTISRNNWIDSGQIIHDKCILITKPHLVSIIPEAVDFNHGNLELKPYNYKFIGKKYLASCSPSPLPVGGGATKAPKGGRS